LNSLYQARREVGSLLGSGFAGRNIQMIKQKKTVIDLSVPVYQLLGVIVNRVNEKKQSIMSIRIRYLSNHKSEAPTPLWLMILIN
jgi:hypothetical protein